MFLKPKHFIFECRPNFGSFCPLPGLLRAITFSAPKPPPLQISAYATGCEKEVKKRVQAGWNEWRRVSGVICDKRLPARVKGKVYSSVVRPAMVYGLETVAVTKKQVEEMEVAEMKMLRFAMGVTRKDKIRNEHIRSTVKVERLGMKMREVRLRWYGHVMRREQEYLGRKMMEMELPGKRRRGRPKRRFLDVVKEDMGEVGAKETDIEDRKMWRMMIAYAVATPD